MAHDMMANGVPDMGPGASSLATPRAMGEAASGTVVSFEDVRLTLNSRAGPVEILRGITLDIARGQSAAIVGPSGSGKTSLMMLMAGLERATSGRIVVAGHVLTGLGEDKLTTIRGQNIGIVFQSFHLVGTMTALENVALPLEFAGRADAEPVARAMLGEVGLAHRLDHFPAQLSGGEQQRVALARALAPRPQLILADEPTGNLDGATGGTIIELLFGLQRRHGATLVLVTHDVELAGLCDRIVHMADGRIVGAKAATAGMPAAGRLTASPAGRQSA